MTISVYSIFTGLLSNNHKRGRNVITIHDKDRWPYSILQAMDFIS